MSADEAAMTELRDRLEHELEHYGIVILPLQDARVLYMTLQHWMKNPPTVDEGPPL